LFSYSCFSKFRKSSIIISQNEPSLCGECDYVCEKSKYKTNQQFWNEEFADGKNNVSISELKLNLQSDAFFLLSCNS